MECRSRITLFFLLSVVLSLCSHLSIAADTQGLRLSYDLMGVRSSEPLPQDPLSMSNQDVWSSHLQRTEINANLNVVTVHATPPIPDTIDEEKAGFIRWLLPQIEQAREEIGHLMSTSIPNSLIVAQAALESGWGTSFGAKNRQNLFGLMRSNGQGMTFSSSLDGLKKYMLTLDQHPAYRTLRSQLGKTTNSLELTKYLTGYCNCTEYSSKLNKIIRTNKLALLD